MPPLYEYQCKDGHVTESRQLLAVRAAHVRCQTCGKRAKHVLSATPGRVTNPAAGPRKGSL